MLHAQSQPVAFDSFQYSGTNAPTPAVSAGEYQNPILAGFHPDPSICRVGDDFYLINSSFAFFPGIPIFHSRDLVNWKQIGNVIDRPDQLHYARQQVSGAIFAPTIRYHDGTFYVICTMVGADGNFIVTATNAAGPWSNPIKLGFDGIDPSIFFDDDGKAWIANNGGPEGATLYNGHRAIWLQQYDPAAGKMTGPRKVIVNGGVDISKKPIWIEGPHIYKRDGWYYLCCAEGGTSTEHSEVAFRSKSVDGPYVPWDQDPILTQRDLSADVPGAVTCTGHADFVVGPDNQWWAVFLGVRSYQSRFSPMGRETFMLPVQWTDDGWLRILPKGERVPLAVPSPNHAVCEQNPAVPLNGDFSWSDDFHESALAPLWVMLRTPRESWWQVGDGALKLTPRPDLLTGRGNPSFLGYRIQHAHFTALTSLAIPAETNVSAGLVAFQGEQYNYFAAVHQDTNGLSVFLESNRGRGKHEIVNSLPLAAAKNIKIRITADDAKCAFDFSPDGGPWQPLAADLDATLLTSEVAGGFVGAMVGPYARADQASH
jgi:alpha-N-arabinofuranosidase